MSHFTVLVVGENPEAQLAPYHEFECTGHDDQYVIDVDVTEEYQKEFEEQTASAIEKGETPESAEDFVDGWYDTKVVFDESEIDRDGKHKYGYVLVKDGKIAKAIRRTNPNAKWAWYFLGGRWTGYFKLKEVSFMGYLKTYPEHQKGDLFTPSAPDGYADSVLKKHIDVDGIRNDAESKARERYQKAMEIIGHLPQHKPWLEILDEHGFNDDSKYLYDNQPRVIAWRNDPNVHQTFGFFSSADDFIISEEEYVKNARNNALATFAVVMDGNWYEKGEMGWWGKVCHEKDDWAEEFNKLFDSISDDTLVSVYDCHI